MDKIYLNIEDLSFQDHLHKQMFVHNDKIQVYYHIVHQVYMDLVFVHIHLYLKYHVDILKKQA
jgi:hypothetical protein